MWKWWKREETYIKGAPKPRPPWASKKKKPEISFTYSPQKDITAYEVARVVGILEWYRNFRIKITPEQLKEKLKSYPQTIRRHFKIIEE